MRFHLTIMRPPGWWFSHCFDEVAETLIFGLRALGHECSYSANAVVSGAQNILMGPHLCDPALQLPEGTILYNLEQIGNGQPGAVVPGELTERFPIWDYSARNIARWQEQGIEARYVPVGYVPELTRIHPIATQDTDVLFYGSLNVRRAVVLGELQKAADFKVVAYQGFGRARDEVISRAKVVLNMHFYETPQLFEWVRVSYLLANHKAVVSEVSDDDPPALAAGLRIVPHAELADACRALAADRLGRACLEQAGFAAFSQLRERDILEQALSHL